MFMMENAEEIFHFLEEFSKRKPKTIPQELNDYLAHVARTGDPIYQWSLVKSLFKEKLLNVITDFYETTPSIEIPPYPNVDPFNYDIMKNSLLERLDSFTSAPFTVQRICELLTYPRKQYNRVDKFMRAVEKNILVVSTREPGPQRHVEPENGEQIEPIVNGTDNNSEYNVDVEMEDMSWKENAEQQISEPQPSSSDAHISVDDVEARLKAKHDATIENTQEKTSKYESVTPPELNIATDEKIKSSDSAVPEATTSGIENTDKEKSVETETVNTEEVKADVDMKSEEPAKDPLEIPDIKIDDAEMTEQRLKAESSKIEAAAEIVVPENETSPETGEVQQTPVSSLDECSLDSTSKESIDESSSDSTIKEETEAKVISEVSTSSEESSSSSDNTDGNSNSPKTDIETNIDVQEEISQPNVNSEEDTKEPEKPNPEVPDNTDEDTKESLPQIESENYSISDVNSKLPQQLAEPCNTEDPKKDEPKKTEMGAGDKKDEEEQKAESSETNIENKES